MWQCWILCLTLNFIVCRSNADFFLNQGFHAGLGMQLGWNRGMKPELVVGKSSQKSLRRLSDNTKNVARDIF